MQISSTTGTSEAAPQSSAISPSSRAPGDGRCSAANKAPKTIIAYTAVLDRFGRYLAEQGMPTNVAGLSREHIEQYIADSLTAHKAATVALAARVLHIFFAWLVEEVKWPRSPAERVKPPAIPGKSPRRSSRLTTYVSCSRRARARTLLGTPRPRDDAHAAGYRHARAGELLGLSVKDVDLDQNVSFVMGKGRRPRACPFGR